MLMGNEPVYAYGVPIICIFSFSLFQYYLHTHQLLTTCIWLLAENKLQHGSLRFNSISRQKFNWFTHKPKIWMQCRILLSIAQVAQMKYKGFKSTLNISSLHTQDRSKLGHNLNSQHHLTASVTMGDSIIKHYNGGVFHFLPYSESLWNPIKRSHGGPCTPSFPQLVGQSQ